MMTAIHMVLGDQCGWSSQIWFARYKALRGGMIADQIMTAVTEDQEMIIKRNAVFRDEPLASTVNDDVVFVV